LKPENILVNDDCTIQICDFGLSRSLKDVPNQEEINILKQEADKLEEKLAFKQGKKTPGSPLEETKEQLRSPG